ncbi:MAG: hypothetical protein ABEJ80_01960 [Halarchaeum sp.]
MPSTRLSRRGLLAAGASATAALAGCNALRDDDHGRRLRLSLVDGDDTLRESRVARLNETRNPDDEAALDAALAGENYTTRLRKPFGGDDGTGYAERNGTYYALDSVVVGESTVTRPVLRLRETESDAPDAVAAASLPAVDRDALHVAWLAARARGTVGGYPVGIVERGGYVYRGDVKGSRLLDGDAPDAVAYRNETYAVETSRERFREPVYRANAERVADSPAGVESVLRARFLDAAVARESLSERARAILRTARRSGGYEETRPYSDAYAEVLRALDARPYLDGNVEKDAGVHTGVRLVRYDDRYYRCRLRFLGSD